MKKVPGTCYFCEKKVDLNLKRCPHCGQLLSGSKIHLILIGVITMTFTMFFLIQSNSDNRNKAKKVDKKIEYTNLFSQDNVTSYLGKEENKSSFIDKINNFFNSNKSSNNSIKLTKEQREIYKAMGYSNADIKKLEEIGANSLKSLGLSENDVSKLGSELYESMGFSDSDIKELENLGQGIQDSFGSDSPEDLAAEVFGSLFGGSGSKNTESKTEESNRVKYIFYQRLGIDPKSEDDFALSFYDSMNFSDKFLKLMNNKSDEEILNEINRQIIFMDACGYSIEGIYSIEPYQLLGIDKKKYDNLKAESKKMSKDEIVTQKEGVDDFLSYLFKSNSLTTSEQKYITNMMKEMYKDLKW